MTVAEAVAISPMYRFAAYLYLRDRIPGHDIDTTLKMGADVEMKGKYTLMRRGNVRLARQGDTFTVNDYFFDDLEPAIEKYNELIGEQE